MTATCAPGSWWGAWRRTGWWPSPPTTSATFSSPPPPRYPPHHLHTLHHHHPGTHHTTHILLTTTTTTQVPTASPTYFSIQKPGTKHPIHILFTTPTRPFSLYHPHTPYHTTLIPQHPHSPHYTTNILFTTPPITHTPNFSPWLFRKSFVTFLSYGQLVKVVIAFRLNIWGRMTR